MDLKGIESAVSSNQQKGPDPFSFAALGKALTKKRPEEKVNGEEDASQEDVLQEEDAPTNRAEGMDMSAQGDPGSIKTEDESKVLSPAEELKAAYEAKVAARASRGSSTITADMVKKGGKKGKKSSPGRWGSP
jgi:hypothetical protein